MFVIGAVPALIAIPLRAMLPESPRWLASRGRFAEADAALKRIEDIGVKEGKALPPLPRDLPAVERDEAALGDLFKGIYLKRTITVWFMWILRLCRDLRPHRLGADPLQYRLSPARPNVVAYGLVLSAIGLGGALVDDLSDRGDWPQVDVRRSGSAYVPCRSLLRLSRTANRPSKPC